MKETFLTWWRPFVPGRLCALVVVMMVTAFADAPLLNAQGQRASVADVVVDARAGTLLRVFAECNVCEEDYLRQQLAFVNLVRDRMLADVHVLVTSLPSGGGGEQFSIELTGRVPGAALRGDGIFLNRAPHERR